MLQQDKNKTFVYKYRKKKHRALKDTCQIDNFWLFLVKKMGSEYAGRSIILYP